MFTQNLNLRIRRRKRRRRNYWQKIKRYYESISVILKIESKKCENVYIVKKKTNIV